MGSSVANLGCFILFCLIEEDCNEVLLNCALLMLVLAEYQAEWFDADAWMIYSWDYALLRGAPRAWAVEGLISFAVYGMDDGLKLEVQ
ncbi:hypothetical protein Nepgr_032267 [Nepenthes gracilis]|uniref:Uncharacterized protein n=1 Tax=Nepenthes gracilis TaxID=150966 RepID=A0AAD3TJS7_NEPGR|nr:hypothetical protein Nepgr_032267 [Nepenthes gracilis]